MHPPPPLRDMLPPTFVATAQAPTAACARRRLSGSCGGQAHEEVVRAKLAGDRGAAARAEGATFLWLLRPQTALESGIWGARAPEQLQEHPFGRASRETNLGIDFGAMPNAGLNLVVAFSK